MFSHCRDLQTSQGVEGPRNRIKTNSHKTEHPVTSLIIIIIKEKKKRLADTTVNASTCLKSGCTQGSVLVMRNWQKTTEICTTTGGDSLLQTWHEMIKSDITFSRDAASVQQQQEEKSFKAVPHEPSQLEEG